MEPNPRESWDNSSVSSFVERDAEPYSLTDHVAPRRSSEIIRRWIGRRGDVPRLEHPAGAVAVASVPKLPLFGHHFRLRPPPHHPAKTLPGRARDRLEATAMRTEADGEASKTAPIHTTSPQKRISVDLGRSAAGTAIRSCRSRSSKCPSQITPGLVREQRRLGQRAGLSPAARRGGR